MAKKKGGKRKTPSKSSVGNPHIEKALIENFIALQKVMTNLSVNFDGLSDKISKLLDLFEVSAKTLAEKDFNADRKGRKDEDLSKKLDELVDQNKIIARGLTLLHENPGHGSQEPSEPISQKRENMGNEYQKSISSKP